jgi:hypothetical protein
MTTELPADIAAAIYDLEAWHEDTLRGYATGSYDAVRAALDAAILRHIGGGWRPIATAPEDGEFLAGLHVRHNDPKTGAVSVYEQQHVVAIDEETGDVADAYDQGWRLLDYEFWKPLDPLPEAPTDHPIVGTTADSASEKGS